MTSSSSPSARFVPAASAGPVSAPASVCAPAAFSPAVEHAMAGKPSLVTVMCPTGITPYAAEGLTLDKPLFARVTYRPV